MATPSITYHRFDTDDVLRNPRAATDQERIRRALMLIGMTLLLPGSAQIAAGSRRLGRIALPVSIACWFTLLLGVVMFFTLRSALLTVLTQTFVMWLVVVVLVALAIGWLVIWLDTFRLLRVAQLSTKFRPVAIVLLVALMVLTTGGLGYAANLINASRTSFSEIFASGPAIPEEDGRYNFLLMGADSDEGREGRRPDSIHMVSVNADSGESFIVSIPRNFQNAPFREGSPLWQVYPEGYNCGNECIINFLYTDVMTQHQDLYPDADDPGAEAMMDAVSGILGLEVQGYVMIDMNGFSELVDAMGGVTIDSGGWVPTRGHRPDTGEWGDTWFEPGEQTLGGDEALAYARSRSFSSDYNRIQRQQCIQQAMIGQFTPQNLLTRFTEIMEAGEHLVETNLPQSQLGSFMNLAIDVTGHSPERMTLGPPDFTDHDGLFSTYPDFDQIHQRVDQLIAAEGEEEEPPAEDDATPEDEEESSNDDDQQAPEEESEPVEDVEDQEPRPTPDHEDEAVADDEPSADEVETEPTQPDGSPLTIEYLLAAQDQGLEQVLVEAASNNHECSPAR